VPLGQRVLSARREAVLHRFLIADIRPYTRLTEEAAARSPRVWLSGNVLRSHRARVGRSARGV
jgi:hypothetical protein